MEHFAPHREAAGIPAGDGFRWKRIIEEASRSRTPAIPLTKQTHVRDDAH
jgi:hypothetical protein